MKIPLPGEGFETAISTPTENPGRRILPPVMKSGGERKEG